MVPFVRRVGRGHFVAVSGTKLLGDAIHRGMAPRGTDSSR